MKKISIVEVDNGEIYDAVIEPEDKVKNVLHRLQLGRGILMRSNSSELDYLEGDDLIYQEVSDGEKLRFHRDQRILFENQNSKKGGDFIERDHSKSSGSGHKTQTLYQTEDDRSRHTK